MKKINIIIASIISLIVMLFLFFPHFFNIAYFQYLNMQTITKFEVKWNKVHMNGEINRKTYQQFKEVLEKNPQINTIVEENVPWSLDDDTMIKLAYYVRKKWLNTELLSNSKIYSWWVDLFLAGVERKVASWSIIGVHSWSDGFKEAKDFPKGSLEHEQNRKYIEYMLGIDDFYWFTIYSAPADSIYEMTTEDIKKFWLST